MYPKVFSDFAAAQESYGPTEVLPTPTYFYGLPAGEEISVELEKGKTLIVRCQAIGEADAEGEVRVFFELNGQPRIARVPDRAHGAGARATPPEGGARQSRARRRADAGRRSPASPSPPARTIRAGDVLLSIEAMKMETALHADRDGKIAEVLVKAGDQIDAKDLLLRFA